MKSFAFLLLLLLAAPLPAVDDQPAGNQPKAADSTGHLDQVYRARAAEAYRRGRLDWARRYFEIAARHADKPSQLALAMMHLNGDGVARDPARAYAWLDVAAERGYRDFLVQRERVWDALSPRERERALELARGLHAEYGDAVAKRRHWNRLQSHLAKSLARHPTMTHVMFVVDYLNCRVAPGAVLGRKGSCVDAQYFNDDRFDRDGYWREQDRAWGGDGTVEVGPLRRSRAR